MIDNVRLDIASHSLCMSVGDRNVAVPLTPQVYEKWFSKDGHVEKKLISGAFKNGSLTPEEIWRITNVLTRFGDRSVIAKELLKALCFGGYGANWISDKTEVVKYLKTKINGIA